VVAFAAVAGLALGNANCAAAAAQHAVSRKAPFWSAAFPALLNAAIFCAASVIGVHLGWEMLAAGAPPNVELPETATVDLAAFLVAFAKVAQAWVVEMRRSLDEAAIQEEADKQAAELAAIRNDNRRLAGEAEQSRPRLVHSSDLPTDEAPSRPKLLNTTIKAAAAGGVAWGSAEAAALPADQPAPAAILPFSQPTAGVWPDGETHCRHLIAAEGWRGRNALARETRLTKYRCAQLLDELAPGWNHARRKRPA
jgi:hypothetical protein